MCSARHSSVGSSTRRLASATAGAWITCISAKRVLACAAVMGTVPADPSASATKGITVGIGFLRLCDSMKLTVQQNKQEQVLSSSGDDCSLSSSELPSSIKDNFESGSVSQESWSLIQGGGVGSGCGQLSPHAHGDSLYFNGCKMRQAITRPLDLTRARYSGKKRICLLVL